MAEQAARCDMCGTAGWEWEEDGFAYHAEQDFCLGCYMKQIRSSEEGDSPLPGTKVVLLPKGANPKPIGMPGRRRKKKS